MDMRMFYTGSRSRCNMLAYRIATAFLQDSSICDRLPYMFAIGFHTYAIASGIPQSLSRSSI